jgi:hypothetical protein
MRVEFCTTGWFIFMFSAFTTLVLDLGMQMETGNRYTLGGYDGWAVAGMMWYRTCINKTGKHGGKEMAFETGTCIAFG